MPLTVQILSAWVAEMTVLGRRVTEDGEALFGYPTGRNGVLVAPPADGRAAVHRLAAAGVDGDLAVLYGHVAEVSFPDVAGGLFVHPAAHVVEGLRGAQPTRLTGAADDAITVFGSDGGGALFALGAAQPTVYRLRDGAWLGAVYEVEARGLDVVAPDVPGFLTFLRDEIAREIGDGIRRAGS